MTGSVVPPTRLSAAARAEVRALLLAELTAAGTRARAAGCPPDVLFDVLDARMCAVAEEIGGPAS
ncbi:hypothetical protein [Amycolatopsis sp. cmx-4-68]|uniref:hypothetical protein n=1 Tax=Amycolatopsis sp. cmx-4-68 TaxID=2790938 RepID=UPI00397BA14B